MTKLPGSKSSDPNVPARPPGGARSHFDPPAPPNNGLAVASLAIGIVALVTSPVLIGLGLGIAAMIIGVIARRRVKRREIAQGGGVALLGVVLGAVATAIGLAVGAILVFGFATGQFNSTYQHCLGEHNGMAQYCEQYR